MASKPNRKKQSAQKISMRRELKRRLDRVKARFGNPNMSDKEAKVILKALKSNAKPIELFQDIVANFKDAIHVLEPITTLGANEEFMSNFATLNPELHGKVKDAYQFLKDANEELERVVQQHTPILEEQNQVDDSFLFCVDVYNDVENIQSNLEGNIEQLMHVLSDLHYFYGELETNQAAGETND